MELWILGLFVLLGIAGRFLVTLIERSGHDWEPDQARLRQRQEAARRYLEAREQEYYRRPDAYHPPRA